MSSGNRANRVLEYGSTAMAVTATIVLAWQPSRTLVWMWLLWMASAIGLCWWAVRVRAWGVLAMNVTYFVVDAVGLARLLRVL
jgi:hypothetical protein